MKKFIGAALAAGAAVAATGGVAHAEGFSGSVSMTSDYVFRGLSQTDGGAAVQGSLDYSSGIFYGGVWGSNVNFGATSPTQTASMELDAYAGVKTKLGMVDIDASIVGYFYPNADDALAGGAELDYYELVLSGSIPITTELSLGATVNYSPDYFAETGTAWYGEINGTYTVSDALSFTAAYGHQDVEDIGDYNTWSLGGAYAMHGFQLGLTYTGVSDDAVDDGFVADETSAGDRLTFSIGRSL